MRAIILAGGKGSRLGDLTAEIPKPLVKVGERPIIEILLHCLAKSGVTKATLAVGHMAEKIIQVVDEGEKFGIDIDFSTEEKPMSTVAPIKPIDDLPENFLVVNGDILTDLDFMAVYDAHLAGQTMLTVATHKRTSKIDYGVIETDQDSRAVRFSEKPEYDFTVSMGVYVFSREVLEHVPDDAPFGFDDLMHVLLKAEAPINIYPYDGYWMDIGRPDDLKQANADIAALKHLLAD